MSTQDTPNRHHDTTPHDFQAKSRVETAPEDGLFISQYPYRRQEIPDNVNPHALINSRPILLTQHHLPQPTHITAQTTVHPNRPHVEEVRFDRNIHNSFHYPSAPRSKIDIHTTTDYNYPHSARKHNHHNVHYTEQFYDENNNLITIHPDTAVKTVKTKHTANHNNNPAHREQQFAPPQYNTSAVPPTSNTLLTERRRADELINQVKDNEKAERREHLAHLLPDMDPFAIDQTNDILSDIVRPNTHNSNVSYNPAQLTPEYILPGYSNPLVTDPVQPLRSTTITTTTTTSGLNNAGKSVDQQRQNLQQSKNLTQKQHQEQLKKQQQAQRPQNILASRFDSGGTLFGGPTQPQPDQTKEQDSFTYPIPSTKNTQWSDRDDYKENSDSYDRYIKQNRKDITHQAQVIKQDVTRVKEDVIDLAGDIKYAGKDTIKDVTKEIQHDAKAVGEKIKDLSHAVLRPWENPKASWKQNMDRAYNVARERPSTVNMTAFIPKEASSSVGGTPGVVYNLQVDKDSPHYQEILDKMESLRTPYTPDLAKKKQEWQDHQFFNKQLKEQRAYAEKLNQQTMLGQPSTQPAEINIDDNTLYQQFPLAAQTRNSAITSNRQLLPQQQTLNKYSPDLIHSQILSPFHPSLKQSDNLFYTQDQKDHLESHLYHSSHPHQHAYHESHRDPQTVEMPAKKRIINRKSLTDLSNDYFNSLVERGAVTPAQQRQMWRKDLEQQKTGSIVSHLVPAPVRDWVSGVSQEVDQEARAIGQKEEAREKQPVTQQPLPPRPEPQYFHPKALPRYENDKFEKEHEAYISSSYLNNNKVYSNQVGGDILPIQPRHVNKMKELDFFETNPHHTNPNLVTGQHEKAAASKGQDYVRNEVVYPSTFINTVGRVASNVVNKSSALLYTTPSILATQQPQPQHIQQSQSNAANDDEIVADTKSGFYDRLNRGVKSLNVDTLTDDDLHGSKEYYIIDKSVNTGLNAREKVKDNIIKAQQAPQKDSTQQSSKNGEVVQTPEKLTSPPIPAAQQPQSTDAAAMNTPVMVDKVRESEIKHAPLPRSGRSQFEQQQLQREQPHSIPPPSNSSRSNDFYEKYNADIVQDVSTTPKSAKEGGFWSGIANASSNIVNSATAWFYNDRPAPANLFDIGQKDTTSPPHPHKVAHKIDKMMNQYEDYTLPAVNRMMDKVDDKIDRAVDRTHHAIDNTVDKTHHAIDQTKSSYHNVVDKTKSGYHDAIDTTKNAVSNVAHRFDDLIHPHRPQTTTTITPIDRSSTFITTTTTTTTRTPPVSTPSSSTTSNWSQHHDHPSFDHDFSRVPYLDSNVTSTNHMAELEDTSSFPFTRSPSTTGRHPREPHAGTTETLVDKTKHKFSDIQHKWTEQSQHHHETANEDHTIITHPLSQRRSTSTISAELPHQRALHTIHDNTIIDSPLLRLPATEEFSNRYPHEHIHQLHTSSTAHLAEQENRDGFSYIDDVGNIFYIPLHPSTLQPHQQSTTEIPPRNDINRATQHGVTTTTTAPSRDDDSTSRKRFTFDAELATAEAYYEPIISHDHSTHAHSNRLAETICEEKETAKDAIHSIQDLAHQLTGAMSTKLDQLTHSTQPPHHSVNLDAPLPHNGQNLRTMSPDGTIHTISHPSYGSIIAAGQKSAITNDNTSNLTDDSKGDAKDV